MAEQMPVGGTDDGAWAVEIGPAYQEDAVADLLQLSVEQVSAHGGLLRLTDRSGTVVYPAFQFDGRRLLDGISEVVATLRPVVASTWTIASWLTSPQPSLDDDPPVDRLRGGDTRRVVEAARRVLPRHH